MTQLTNAPSPTLLRDTWLATLCASRTLIAFNFIAYAACLPVLQREWAMSATAAGSIAAAFQLGYGAALLVASWLADRVGARNVFRVSAVASAVAIVLFALFARSYQSGLLLYALVAVAQGGTYTTAIMLVADRYERHRRGTAMGWFLGASSLGYAIALLLIGAALPFGGYPLAFALTAVATVIGCALALAVLRATPNIVHPRSERAPFTSAVLRNRKAMLLIGGYTAHSWELLGMWSWTPAFLAAVLAASGAAMLTAAEFGAYLTAGLHLTGLLSSWSMGFLSDRLGRRTVLIAMAGISAACSLVFGWTITWPVWLVVALGAVYSFTAIGDSSVLSTATTESVDPAHLGATLALRSMLGFGAGAIAPLAFGAVLDATNAADTAPTLWGWAFVTLGLGGIAATACAFALKREPMRPG
ncbi:MAG TPA: MFS transporter [Alphaproteobacteria bacterium]|nr:MFS transporter [Alphaproteobacteria bacterium]